MSPNKPLTEPMKLALRRVKLLMLGRVGGHGWWLDSTHGTTIKALIEAGLAEHVVTIGDRLTPAGIAAREALLEEEAP
jgi:hypothetical protein